MRIYHGTSVSRFVSILDDRKILRSRSGKIAFTIDKKVASYWAVRSAKLDGSANRGLILIFDSAAIEAAGYTLTPYSDPIWGVGVCDWEKEVACWSDLPNFNHFLIDFEVNKGPRAHRPKWVREAARNSDLGRRIIEYYDQLQAETCDCE
jgi:hypothetical protein